MWNKLACAAVAGVVAVSAPAFAIDQAENWEVQLAGSGANDVDFNNGGFTVTAQVGYFFNDQIEVAVRQSASYTDTGADNQWGGATRVAGYYHFNYDKVQKLVPFAGIGIGYIYGDQTADTFVAGPEVGLRYFVNDTTFISGSVAYEFLFDNAGDADSSFSDGQFVYQLAIGFQF